MGRDLDWQGCGNVRDLGGVPIAAGDTAFGVFVRADNARNLTALGWRQASEYGIRSVLDLRSEPECISDPPASVGLAQTRISLFDHYDGDAAYRADLLARVADFKLAEKYRALYSEALELDSERFAQAIGVLANAEGGTLFHCVGGKDRTGVLAAIVLRLVGASMEDVEADYRRTEERADRAVAPHIDKSAPAHVIRQVISDLERQHGSAADYLTDAGVPQHELDEIVKKLVASAQ